MSNTATLSFSARGNALFSRDEVRGLMQVEFERGARYSYPVACLLIQVDHLAQIRTIHGDESKNEVLMSVVDLVKKAMRAGDLLGYVIDDRLVVLVPHTEPKAGKAIGERLLAGARELVFQLDDRTLSVTLSIGLSHNQDPGAKNFATLERVAEEGVRVAAGSGGDRIVQMELAQLCEREREPVGRQELEELLDRAEVMGSRQRLEGLVSEGADLISAASIVAEEVMGSAAADARTRRENELERTVQEFKEKIAGVADVEDAAAFKRDIERLNGRIAELTGSLEADAQALAILTALDGVDGGGDATVRDVQGLDDSDARAGIKKGLMGAFLEARADPDREGFA